MSKLPITRKPKPAPKRATRRDIILVIAAVITIPLIVVVVIFLTQFNQRSYEGRVQGRLFTFCSQMTIEVGADSTPCMTWPESSWVSTRDTALACHEQSPALDAPFKECLLNEGVLPPGVVRNP